MYLVGFEMNNEHVAGKIAKKYFLDAEKKAARKSRLPSAIRSHRENSTRVIGLENSHHPSVIFSEKVNIFYLELFGAYSTISILLTPLHTEANLTVKLN